MGPIVYSSQDAGAPQVFMTAGNINAVIKACLVDGYGDNPAAGWELLAEDLVAHTLTLRSQNPQSIKSVFVIDDSNKNTGPKIQGYLDWNAATSQPVSKYGERLGQLNRNAESRPVANAQKWIIIADDKWVWFWLSTNDYGSFGCTQGFGDCISIDSTLSASAIMGYENTIYAESNQRINTAISSVGELYIANQPFDTKLPSKIGDMSDVFASNIFVFSAQMLYKTNADNKKEPAFLLPGLMSPAAQITYIAPPSNRLRIIDLPSTIRGVGLLRQTFHGYVPILLDDWG